MDEKNLKERFKEKNTIFIDKECDSLLKIVFTATDNINNFKTAISNNAESISSKQNFTLSTDSGFKSDITSSSSSSSFCENSLLYKKQTSGTSEDSIPVIIDYNNHSFIENKHLDDLYRNHIKPRPIKVENSKIKNKMNSNGVDREKFEKEVELNKELGLKFQPSGAVFKSTLFEKKIKKACVKVNSNDNLKIRSSSSSSNEIVLNEKSENFGRKQNETIINNVKPIISVSPNDNTSTSSISSTYLSNNQDNEVTFSSQSSSPNSPKILNEFENYKQKEKKKYEHDNLLLVLSDNKTCVSPTPFIPISICELLSTEKSVNNLQASSQLSNVQDSKKKFKSK